MRAALHPGRVASSSQSSRQRAQRDKELVLPISSSRRHRFKLHTKKKEEMKIKPTTSLLCGDTAMAAMHHFVRRRSQTRRALFTVCYRFLFLHLSIESTCPLHRALSVGASKFSLYRAFKLDLFNQSSSERFRLRCRKRIAALATFCCFHLELEQRTVCSVRRRATRGEEFQVLLMRQAGSTGVNGRKAQ